MADTLAPKIGKYEVLSVIGAGGMGVVYKAVDPQICRLVAIKKMNATLEQGSELLQRFYREAQAAGNLQHPNIVVIYDLGDEDGTPYLVMQYLEGSSLEKVLSTEASPPLIRVLDIAIQVCHGLECAHQHGIVHRDVKPANVFLTDEGTVKLLDFGIARATMDKTLTHSGQIIGTLKYMSPEQLNGGSVDGRSDIFATGVMLYQMLTRNTPFDAPDTAAMIVKILHEPAPPLSQYSDYPPQLQHIVERALAKDVNCRYASAEDFASDLISLRQELERNLTNDYLAEAQQSLQRHELKEAKSLLMRILSIDRRNIAASQMFSQVQESEQVRDAELQELHAQARKATANKEYERAIVILDRALQLNHNDPDLLHCREAALQMKARGDRLNTLISLAQSAAHAGEVQLARTILEDALALDAADVRVRELESFLTAEVEKQGANGKLQALLAAARQEISAGHFTQVYDLIRQAEAIDPSFPEIRQLKEEAVRERKSFLSQFSPGQSASEPNHRPFAGKRSEREHSVPSSADRRSPRDAHLPNATSCLAPGDDVSHFNTGFSASDAGATAAQNRRLNPQPNGTISDPAWHSGEEPSRGNDSRPTDVVSSIAKTLPKTSNPPTTKMPAEPLTWRLLIWRRELLAGIATSIVLSTLLVFFGLRRHVRPAVPAAVSYELITAQPWGTVRSVAPAHGKPISVNQQTPLRLPLAPGRYRITMASPQGVEYSDLISVPKDGTGIYNHVFKHVDAQSIVNSY